MIAPSTLQIINENPDWDTYYVYYYDIPALNAAIRALIRHGKEIRAAAHIHTWSDALTWYKAEYPNDPRNDYYQEFVMMGITVEMDNSLPLQAIKLYNQ